MTSGSSLINTLFDNLGTAVLVFDENLHLSIVNAAAENLLRMSARKARGLEPADVLPLAPQFAEAIDRAVETRQAFTEWGMELQLADGKSIVADCIITPVLEDEHQTRHQVIVELISTHMHSRIVREENLQSLHDAARESMRAVAHEVKNPLGGLRGAAQLLERDRGKPQGIYPYHHQ